jgi:hypothetical protein
MVRSISDPLAADLFCRSRESGNPVATPELDSRFRGDDKGLML